jgi:lipopolysaccharide/colanic/teichoic acid biosynthesis glycosyltransferase
MAPHAPENMSSVAAMVPSSAPYGNRAAQHAKDQAPAVGFQLTSQLSESRVLSRSIGQRLLAALRRLVEIGIAGTALVVTSPILLIIAVIIKLDSPGPALFRQERVGLHGKLILFCKFRTMFVNARELYPELYAYKYSPEEIRRVRLKKSEDPRVTRVGKWLRRSTLDELPNFWNVLTGDVAIVGPRPDIAGVLPYFTPAQMIKFSVKPGITGLAQTRGRGRLRFQDQIRYDIFYARKKSFWLDVKIIFQTMKQMLTSDGAF